MWTGVRLLNSSRFAALGARPSICFDFGFCLRMITHALGCFEAVLERGTQSAFEVSTPSATHLDLPKLHVPIATTELLCAQQRACGSARRIEDRTKTNVSL